MVTKKDFYKAAIRLFSDIILADGFIVKEELVYLAKVAKDYKLSSVVSSQKMHVGCDDNDITLSFFDEKIIQDARKLTFSGAINIIKEWRKEHRDDVNDFVKQLAELSVIDGECSPKEAGIRLSLQYALEKDAIVFSVNKDYRFSRNEIIYIENDIHDEAIRNKIIDHIWENENSDIWIGFEEYRESHRNENVQFSDYLYNYYRQINEDIDVNFHHYQRELKLLGFDLAYIPQTINKLNNFGDSRELIMPALQIINPFKLYGKEFDSVVKALSEIKTYDFTNALLHSHQDLIAEATPSLLVKMGNSKIIDTSNNSTISSVQYSDFIIVKIENGSLKYTLDKFQSNYLALTKRHFHVVSEFYDTRINIHGFDRTLLEYAVNRVYGKEVISKVIFDIRKKQVYFVFSEGIRECIKLSSFVFAYYILVMYKPIPKLPVAEGIDFDYGNNKDIYSLYYQIQKEYNGIYRSIHFSDTIPSLYKKGVLAKVQHNLKKSFDGLSSQFNYSMYCPHGPRERDKDVIEDENQFQDNMYLLRNYKTIRKSAFICLSGQENFGNLVPLSEWVKSKMEDYTSK